MATSQQLAAFAYAVPGPPVWNPVRSASFTAVAGNAYAVNTTSAAVTVTLPANPNIGQVVQIIDYAGTFGTNNCTINPNGSKISGSTSNVVLNINREAAAIVYVDSTQGWLGYGNFINNPVAIPPYTISYLIAAGGGGGGGSYGGGGGAGGLLTNSSYSVSGGDLITVTVGAGGAGGSGATQSAGGSGNNSIIAGPTTITTYGGGGGGGNLSKSGLNGGSGGGTSINGGSAGIGVYPGSTYINAARQGYDGGAPGDGVGGGGAGAVGSGTGGGTGAISTIITTAQASTYAVGQVVGSDVYFAGGGGGWGRSSLEPGGNGGGGNGAYTGAATAGTANTGGGGGGGTGDGNGASGGSGVVILSIPTTNYTGVKTGSPTVFTSGSSTILIFTASGSYTA